MATDDMDIDEPFAEPLTYRLPGELLLHVFLLLDTSAVRSVRAVSQRWLSISDSDAIWKQLCFNHKNYGFPVIGNGRQLSKLQKPPSDSYREFFCELCLYELKKRTICRALYDYTAQEDNELSFKASDLIIVITESSDSESGWWTGYAKGHVGLFPAEYVETLEDTNTQILTPITLNGPKIKFKAVNLESTIHLLNDVMKPYDCRKHIARCEQQGFQTALHHNSVCPYASKCLNNTLWPGISDKMPYVTYQNRIWTPIGINPESKVFKYKAGDYSAMHIDGPYTRDSETRSFLSIIIYMNSDFIGGNTTFFSSPVKVYRVVRPRGGLAIVFPHVILHASESVSSGLKYLYRSDIVYKCTDMLATGDYSHLDRKVIQL